MFAALLPGAPPVNPAPDGAAHVNVVPAGTTPLIPFAGVTTKASPLHSLLSIDVSAGVGLIVTSTVNVAPVQIPDNGVTV